MWLSRVLLFLSQSSLESTGMLGEHSSDIHLYCNFDEGQRPEKADGAERGGLGGAFVLMAATYCRGFVCYTNGERKSWSNEQAGQKT